MVQSGIAYAAGQLLAVVAPRTVLVVDAPTDWSLAGPLWELALDDAPVDEILDVLIRRGIRTSPSFAIVRVETDAVRALVRGSVPVCFERAGEPVRLDATGATTWLEGLISGARRVLVGDVEANTTLPFLVSTGVVLVSGLALPTGPVEPERRQISSTSTNSESEARPAAGDLDRAPAEGASYFNPPVPVSSGGGPFAPVAGREPRVVDLTRSEPRSPARSQAGPPEAREARTFPPNRNGDLNGHAPSVLDSPSSSDSGASDSSSAPLFGSPTTSDSAPFSFQSSSPSPFEPPAPSDRGSDDPGELHDLDQPISASAAPAPPAPPAPVESYRPSSDFRPSTGSFESRPLTDSNPFSTSDHGSSSRNGSDRFSDRSSDDLLTDPADGERPAGPSPVDMPRLAPPPPSLSLPLPSALNGSRSIPPPVTPPDSQQNSAPSAWPPAPEQPSSNEPADNFPSAWSHQSTSSDDSFAAPASAFARPGTEPPAREPESLDPSDDRPPANRNQDRDQPQLAELPLRVRGRSLRPEQPAPMNGHSAELPPAAPEPPSRALPAPLRVLGEGRFRNVSDAENPQVNGRSEADQNNGPDEPASGSLALPAFFRGSRPGSGKPDEPESAVAMPAPRELEAGPSSGGPDWSQNSSGSSDNGAPVAWAPPVRRTFGERPGFNGGPPSMPPVLRPVSSHNPAPSNPDDEYSEMPTEFAPAPGFDNDSASDSREPARLLGVWCDAGHVTSPDRRECRVCGLSVPPQAPILVARPPLGVLIFDNGDRVEVDRPVVLGRDPKPIQSSDPEPPILHAVSSSTGQVSRTHAEIRADDWDVVLTDLGAMNGTALTLPGESPVAIEPGVATVITPGARVDLGGESGFVFEIEG